jgi:ABC-type transport system involved in multi-copper enzyme maturation permease subunit
MNSTLAIAQRELNEKRFVFVAATAFLVLALVMPLMPGVHAGQRAAALIIGSVGLSAVFTLGLATILGATIVGRDLSDGRLSFYFSKPVPATSIWWGKVIAAGALLAACYIIIGFPALIIGVAAPRDAVEFLASVPLIAVGLFLLSHVIGTFVRSRSAWVLVDLMALAVVAATAWILTLWLLNGYAFELLRRLGEIFVAFVSLTVLAAGAWQIAQGRTDRRRSHKELSRFLWTSIGGGLLIAAAYVTWVVSATPRDVPVPEYVNQSSGSWAFLAGRARNRVDYYAQFLYNIESGRFLRTPKMQSWWAAGVSDNGRVAVWVVPSREGDEVHLAQLDSPKLRDTETPFRLAKWQFFTISPDGWRMATVDKQAILTIDDLRNGNSLGSVRIPTGERPRVVFVNSDLLRVYTSDSSGLHIFEFDVTRKLLTPTGIIPNGTFRLSADNSRMILRVFRDSQNRQVSNELQIRDSRSGALLQTIPGNFWIARFLRDGRIAAITGDKKELMIFSGGAALTVPMNNGADWIYESPGGPITTCTRGGWCTVVDPGKGAVLRTEAGIYPLSYYSTASRMLMRWRGETVIWDPATGEKRPMS